MKPCSVVSNPDRKRNAATAQLRNGLNATEASHWGRQWMSTTAVIAAPRTAWR